VAHCLLARLKYKHWASLSRLSVTFITTFGAVAVSFGLWPVISNPDVKQIGITGEILTCIFLGLLATLAVSCIAIRDNLLAMQNEKRPTENTEHPPGRSRSSSGQIHENAQ
jgi:hypothetical protein